MATPLEKLRGIVKSYVKDLAVKEALKNALIEDMTQEIMEWFQDEYGKPLQKQGRVTFMTPEASQSVDDMRRGQGKARKPGSL